MTTTIHPLSTSGTAAAPPVTIGGLVSEWDSNVHARLTALETKAAADAKSAGAWLKANWHNLVGHLGTWGALGYVILKHL